MGAVRTRYLAPTIPICTLHWTLTYLGTSMYIGPHTCMSGYVSAYHGVGKLCILLHTILCHAVHPAFRAFTTATKAKFSSHSAPLEERVQRKYSLLAVKIRLSHTTTFALSYYPPFKCLGPPETTQKVQQMRTLKMV